MDLAKPTPSFEGWYASVYQPSLNALLIVCAGDRSRAEDAIAEAFSRALERWTEVSSMDAPQAWVIRVAINFEKRRLRRRGKEAELIALQPAAVDSPYRESDEQLWALVKALSPRRRRAIVLRYVADWSQQQIADDFAVAPGTAAATLHQARSELRASLQLDNGGD